MWLRLLGGLFALFAACAATGGLAVGSTRLPPARELNPIQIENALPGTSMWNRPQVGSGIEAYASEVSVAPGGIVHLHVATSPAARYRLEIFRLGWYDGAGGRLVDCLPDCAGSRQGVEQKIPSPDSATGLLRLRWPVTDLVPVGSDWVSGYYYVDVVVVGGRNAGVVRHVPVIVVAAPAWRSAILAQASVNTWQAYNGWGGISLYTKYGQPQGSHVSFDRPYDNIHQGPGSWELASVHFLERHGYDVSYTTDVDTDRNPASLLEHALVMTLGHDEYWTARMRNAFETARDSGVNLAFIGANNGYWQARYEDDRRTLVEYRDPRLDPEPDPSLKTSTFRSLSPPRPECQLTGVDYGAIGDSEDYTVTAAALTDPWFSHTGFSPGDSVHGLVGYEWDGIQPHCPPAGVTGLFHYDGLHGASPAEGQRSNADAVRYTAPSGARVFAAGSFQFAWGLDPLQERYDPRLDRFMRNGLDDLTRPSPPAFVTATLTRAGVLLTTPTLPGVQARALVVFRHRGAASFTPRDQDLVRVVGLPCTTFADQPGGGVYRWAIAYASRWRLSVAILTPTIHAPAPSLRSSRPSGCIRQPH